MLGPAEQAGLQKGDVIAQIGEQTIANIYDYTYALGERKPGEAVELVVKREGAEVALQVILGARGER